MSEHSYNKYDVFKFNGNDFTEESNKVIANTLSYQSLEKYLSPIISKSRDFILLSKEEVIKNVKRHPNMNSYMFNKMVESAVEFYLSNKNRKLPITDIKTHRSLHLKSQLFEFMPFDMKKWQSTYVFKNYQIRSVHQLVIDGLKEPLYVENLSTTDYKYLILRPKLSKMGNISDKWEVLLFKNKFDYLIDHIDLDYIPGKYNR